MRHRLLPRPLLSLAVFLVWALITNAASLALLVLGGVLALVVPQLTAPFWARGTTGRPNAGGAWLPRRLCLGHRHWQLGVGRPVIGPVDRLVAGLGKWRSSWLTVRGGTCRACCSVTRGGAD